MNYIHEGNHAYGSHITLLYNASLCGMCEVKANPAMWVGISLIIEGLQAWGFAETCTYFNHFKSSCPWILFPSTWRRRKWWHPPTDSGIDQLHFCREWFLQEEEFRFYHQAQSWNFSLTMNSTENDSTPYIFHLFIAYKWITKNTISHLSKNTFLQ